MYKAFIVSFLFIIEFPSFGQCDNSVQPTRNEMLKYKSRGNRCEGEYSAKVGAQSLEIVSLTIGKFSYKMEKNESIEIENKTGNTINIRSSAIPIDTYYRMDAKLENGQAFKWTIEDVLFKLEIPSSDLGVYGWNIADERNKIYFPVKPVSSTYDEKNENIYLLIRPSSKVVSVKYRYAPIGQSQSDYKTIGGPFKSRQAVEIILPSDLEGVYMIEIAVFLQSKGSWESTEYKIRL